MGIYKNRVRAKHLKLRIKELGLRCRFCGDLVSTLPPNVVSADYDYPYTCNRCEEDFYEFECIRTPKASEYKVVHGYDNQTTNELEEYGVVYYGTLEHCIAICNNLVLKPFEYAEIYANDGSAEPIYTRKEYPIGE